MMDLGLLLLFTGGLIVGVAGVMNRSLFEIGLSLFLLGYAIAGRVTV